MSEKTAEKNAIPVLGNAIRLIERIAHDGSFRSVKEISSELGIAPSTCYRALQTFVACDWLRKGKDGSYELSFGALNLARPLMQQDLLIEVTRKPLEALSRSTEKTVKTSVLMGDRALTIDVKPAPVDPYIAAKVGSSLFPVFGVAGPVLLSRHADAEIERLIARRRSSAVSEAQKAGFYGRLKDVREKGYCSVLEYGGSKLGAISVPVEGPGGEILAAISILGFSNGFAGARMEILAERTLRCATECKSRVCDQV